MSFPLPTGRDARAALVTSWIVLAYLLIQLVASMALQVDDSLVLVIRVAAIVAAVGSVVGFLRIQSLVLSDRVREEPWLRWSLISIGVVLLPVADTWALLGVSLATLLLTSTARQVTVLGTLLTALVVLALVLQGAVAVAVIGIPMVCWLAAGVMSALTAAAARMQALRTAREQLALQRIDEERHRISRELHDILGRTLVAVSVRTQTALRLIDRDVDACRRQLEQIAETTTDGQAQLRRLIQGEVIVGLDTELTNAEDLFRRMGVSCEIDRRPICGVAADTLAAQILREAVTNMLKHSRPRQAWIGVRDEDLATVLSVVNDGCPVGVTHDSAGTGLADLAGRVSAAGGTLQAGSTTDGRFRVIARIPHPDPTDTPDPARQETGAVSERQRVTSRRDDGVGR